MLRRDWSVVCWLDMIYDVVSLGYVFKVVNVRFYCMVKFDDWELRILINIIWK